MRHTRFLSMIAAASLAAAAVFCGIWRITRPEPPLSPELETPKLVMATVGETRRSRPIFFTRAALPWMKEHWAEWGSAFGASVSSPEELLSSFEPALHSPQSWHVLDRKWRFGAILLSGDPSGFRSLLDALRQSQEWTLTSLDATSYLFERSPATPWVTGKDLPKLLESFQAHPPREQQMARAQIAHRLMFLGEIAETQALLEEILKANPKSKEAWTEMAFLHGMSNAWVESLKAAEHALSLDDHYVPARIAQAGALYGMNRFGEALLVTRSLYEDASSDGQVLLLHAKVTHSAHAFQEEIEVLQRLVGLLQGRSRPVGLWQIYLGQAYAATGNAMLAEDQFKLALKDASLSESDRDFIRKAIERLEMKPEAVDLGPALPQKSSLLDGLTDRP